MMKMWFMWSVSLVVILLVVGLQLLQIEATVGFASASTATDSTDSTTVQDDIHAYDLHANTQSISPQDILLDSEVALFVYRPKTADNSAAVEAEQQTATDWVHIDLSIYNHPNTDYYIVIHHEDDSESSSHNMHDLVLCSGLYRTKAAEASDGQDLLWSCGVAESSLRYGDNAFIVSIYKADNQQLCLKTNTHVFYPKDNSESHSDVVLLQAGSHLRDHLLIPLMRNRKVLMAGCLFLTTTFLLFHFQDKQEKDSQGLVYNSGDVGFGGDDFGGRPSSRPWYFPLGINYYAPLPVLPPPPPPSSSAVVTTSKAVGDKSNVPKSAVASLPAPRQVPLLGGVIQKLLLQAPPSEKVVVPSTTVVSSTAASSTSAKFFAAPIRKSEPKPFATTQIEEEDNTESKLIQVRNKVSNRVKLLLQRWKVTPERMRTGVFIFTVAVLVSRTHLVSTAIGTTSAFLSKSKISIFGFGKAPKSEDDGSVALSPIVSELPTLPSPTISTLPPSNTASESNSGNTDASLGKRWFNRQSSAGPSSANNAINHKKIPEGNTALSGITLDEPVTKFSGKVSANSPSTASQGAAIDALIVPKDSIKVKNIWQMLASLIRKTIDNLSNKSKSTSNSTPDIVEASSQSTPTKASS